MLSGAPILLVIVALWAAYLVPMFLTRYDRATESRSIDRFSTAMGSLRLRQGGRPESREIVMPPRGHHASATSARGTAPGLSPARAAARTDLLARRRRVMLVLLGAAVGMALLALLGLPGALAAHVLADLLLVAYVGYLRRLAVATASRSASTQSRPAPARRTQDPARPQAHRDQLARAAEGATAPRRRPDLDSWLPRRIPSRAVLLAAPRPGSRQETPVVRPAAAARRVPVAVEFEAETLRATGTGGPWSPVPVPPPVYTTKPVAHGRVVDLTVPGAWTAANVLADLENEVSPVDETIELDALLDHRWAVND